MSLSLVSINYKHAPLHLRERLAIPAPELPGLLHGMREACALEELMVLSTCNRVEFYHTGPRQGASVPSLLEWMEENHPGWDGELGRSAVILSERPALVHLFRVACSLESMVIGEPQILGQVKEGYQIAQEQGTLGPYLRGLMPKAFHAAKRVRSETDIARFPVSVSKVAVDLAGQIFENLEESTAMVIGAGEMAELVIDHLRKAGVRRLQITNRTFSNAVALAERFQGSAVRFENLADHLAAADIVISSTGAPGFVIGGEEARKAQKARRGKPIFFIDIAVPRDVHPDVNELANVYCYDVDDLQSAAAANHREREEQAYLAQRIVEDEVEGFLRWQEAGAVTPVITALRGHFLALGEAELDKALGRMKHLPQRDAESVRQIVDGIVKKLLHTPSTRLKRMEEGGDAQLYAHAVAEAFGLDPFESPAKHEKEGEENVVRLNFSSEGKS